MQAHVNQKMDMHAFVATYAYHLTKVMPIGQRNAAEQAQVLPVTRARYNPR